MPEDLSITLNGGMWPGGRSVSVSVLRESWWTEMGSWAVDRVEEALGQLSRDSKICGGTQGPNTGPETTKTQETSVFYPGQSYNFTRI